MSTLFAAGHKVAVAAYTPPGHVRTPYFLRGRQGLVVEVLGSFRDPEVLAYGRAGPPANLYRVRFAQPDLWPDYRGGAGDTLVADIFESWLEPVEDQGS